MYMRKPLILILRDKGEILKQQLCCLRYLILFKRIQFLFLFLSFSFTSFSLLYQKTTLKNIHIMPTTNSIKSTANIYI